MIFRKDINGMFLKSLKQIPLHKHGAKNDANNNLPISIFSPINRTFESLLHERLVNFFDKYEIFSSNQFKFKNVISQL